MKRKAKRVRLYIAHHFDNEDKIFRVAGVYSRKRDADKRITDLGCGGVQMAYLNRPLRLLVPEERAK